MICIEVTKRFNNNVMFPMDIYTIDIYRMKSILQYTIEGEFVSEYQSMSEASRLTNTTINSISECCLGKRKTAGGFIWKYKEQKYPKRTEEEKLAYQRAYYAKNKERINKRLREEYAKKNADKPKKVAMTKEERLERAKEKYRIKHNVVEKYENKMVCNAYNKRYKGFKFSYSKGILSFEVKLPFRIQIEKYDAKHTDEETYTLLYRELKHKLRSIDPTQTIFIFEPEKIQYYSANIESMDKVVETVKEFIIEQTEKYGRYVFRNKKNRC